MSDNLKLGSLSGLSFERRLNALMLAGQILHGVQSGSSSKVAVPFCSSVAQL